MTATGLELALGAGWLVAAILLGFWWGERGRRLDAQAREGVIPTPSRQPKATVLEPDYAKPSATADSALSEAFEGYVENLVAQGYRRKDAEADAKRVFSAAALDRDGTASTVLEPLE